MKCISRPFHSSWVAISFLLGDYFISPRWLFHSFPSHFILLGVLFHIHFILFQLTFHSPAQDIFIPLPRIFSFSWPGYFPSFTQLIFILLPRIFSFPCLGYFHSLAQDIFILLPSLLSFSCPGYFHSLA